MKQSALFVSKIAYIIKLMPVTNVGKNFRGVSLILVYVVKVGKQELSPAEKLIYRLGFTCDTGKTLVQLDDGLEGISNGK